MNWKFWTWGRKKIEAPKVPKISVPRFNKSLGRKEYHEFDTLDQAFLFIRNTQNEDPGYDPRIIIPLANGEVLAIRPSKNDKYLYNML